MVLEVGPDGTAEYYREPDGSLVARIMPESGYGDEMQFYHFDALGNTVLLTRPDGDYGFGRLHTTYYYGAWGEAYSYGLPVDNPYQYVGQLGYYTHYQDATLGMLQLGVRFYEPGTGRFGQRDPLHFLRCPPSYEYAKSNPSARVDPTGEIDEALRNYYICVGGCVVKLVTPGVVEVAGGCVKITWPVGRPPKDWMKNPEYIKKVQIDIKLPGIKGGTPGLRAWRILKLCAKLTDITAVLDLVSCLYGCVKDNPGAGALPK